MDAINLFPWFDWALKVVVGALSAIAITGVWHRLKWWPFSPESPRESPYYNIIRPYGIQTLLIRPRGNKSLRLERIIPSPEYVPNTLQIKCYQEHKTLFDAPLIAGISERGIMNGSDLLISIRKPLRVEIKNLSNLNQGIRLSFLSKGSNELVILEGQQL